MRAVCLRKPKPHYAGNRIHAWRPGSSRAQTSPPKDPSRREAQRLFETGRVGFNLSCAPCHQESGEGRAGLAPALVGSRWVTASDEPLISLVLHGKENPGRGLVMPPWRHLEDSQISAILTYVRREFGNRDVVVRADSVATIRAATHGRTKAWTDPELEAIAVPTAAGTR